jgi:hypothetical protein
MPEVGGEWAAILLAVLARVAATPKQAFDFSTALAAFDSLDGGPHPGA